MYDDHDDFDPNDYGDEVLYDDKPKKKKRSTAPPMEWHEVWLKAVTSPNEYTYEDIANQPNANGGTATKWLALTTLVMGVIAAVIMGLFYDMTYLFVVLLYTGFAIVVGIIGFWIWIGLVQVVAKALNGTGTFGQLGYTYASFYLPLSIVGGLLQLIPIIGTLIGFALGLYQLFLQVLAVKVVNEFGWGKAVISTFAIVGLLFCMAIGTIVVLALMGPAIGDIFSEIVLTLEAPQ